MRNFDTRPPAAESAPVPAPAAAALLARIDAAADDAALEAAAGELPAVVDALLAGGGDGIDIGAQIARINDRVCGVALDRLVAAAGLDPRRACWLVMGSQARGEQTLVTDQDNAWVLADGMAEDEAQRWRAVGAQANALLARCGVPLCDGDVMAGQPPWCLALAQWRGYIDAWMQRAGPAELLSARIVFDLHGLWGQTSLADALRAHLAELAPRKPRFLAAMARNILRNRVPLTWWGGIAATAADGAKVIDLKRAGTQVIVDAARLLALAAGSTALGTPQRLSAAVAARRLGADEAAQATAAFEALLSLRLQLQRGPWADAPAALDNRVPLATLSAAQRVRLKPALRAAARLQQRIELDWPAG